MPSRPPPGPIVLRAHCGSSGNLFVRGQCCHSLVRQQQGNLE